MHEYLRLSRCGGAATLVALGSLVGGGCSTWQPDQALISEVDSGEYGLARQRVAAKVAKNVAKSQGEQGSSDEGSVNDQDRLDREYVLDQIRYAMIDLADGQYAAAETPFLAAYDILRTAGINDDNTLNTILQTEEGARYWKGEPFEQAAAYAYFAAQLAAVGDWGNASAAAQNSLFLLQDFTEVIEGGKADIEAESGAGATLSALEIVYAEAEKAQADATAAAIAEGDSEEEAAARGRAAFDAALDNGYQPIETNFAPGYFMKGLGRWASSRELGDIDFEKDARDNFRDAIRYAPGLEDVVNAIVNGEANTVFWVDYGKGPEKYRTGYRETLAEYRIGTTTTPSSREPLRVKVGSAAASEFDIAADFNEYALDHRWRSNQELRQAKAIVGDALLYAGLAYAATSDDYGEAAIALAVAGIGALLAETSKADIRHIEILPQRSYFAAVSIDEPGTTVDLSLAGIAGSRIVLPGMSPPDGPSGMQFRYLRLNRTPSAPGWATSGRVVWANDHTGSVPRGSLPYIMGGRCVRSPTAEVLREYQSAGNLLGITLVELQNLYRAEGLTWDLSDQLGVSRTHVLEGGTSLIAPPPGTVGFVRLFCGAHETYVPKSVELQQLMSTAEQAEGSLVARAD